MGIQRPITTPSSCNLVAISPIHNRLINHANMPAVRHPCSPLVKGHPCGEELLPSVYQAALSHAGSYVRRASSQHTPWEAVTFVAISAEKSISSRFQVESKSKRFTRQSISGQFCFWNRT